MINYIKARQNFEKSSSYLNKGLAINKSHASSINIKLSQDVFNYDDISIPLKSVVKYNHQPYLQTQVKQILTSYNPHSKNNSIKLQSRDKQNQVRRKQTFDISIIRPYQETNRYIQTSRNIRQCSRNKDRSLSKNSHMQLKNQQNQAKLKTEDIDLSPVQTQNQSAKYLNEINKCVKVSVSEMRLLLQQFFMNQSDVEQMKRQLQFYQRLAEKNSTNSVLLALKN